MKTILRANILTVSSVHFYPTFYPIFSPLGLSGYFFFTHGVWMGGQAGGQVKSCPGYILATVRCRKLILGKDIS